MLLRTAQSLEYTVIDAYAAARATRRPERRAGHDRATIRRRPHRALGQRSAGSSRTRAARSSRAPIRGCTRRVIDPIFDAIDGSDDQRRDVLNFVQALEILARRVLPVVRRIAHRAGPPDEDDADRGRREPPRGDAGDCDHRHARRVREPGVARRAGARRGTRVPRSSTAIPSTFGTVSAIELVVGAPERGWVSGFTVLLQTPAANTYVYSRSELLIRLGSVHRAVDWSVRW